jgi:hypothetical protein
LVAVVKAADTAVLDVVRDRITVAGFCPTIAEIARSAGVSSSEAHRAIDRLVQAGKLAKSPRARRGLELVDAPDLRLSPTAAIVAELRRRGIDVAHRPSAAVGRRAATCAADTCGESVKVGYLMCRRHWFMLPDNIRFGLKAARAAGETARYQALLTTAVDIADGLTPEARARRVG